MNPWRLRGTTVLLCLSLTTVSSCGGKYHPLAYHPLVRANPDAGDRWYNLGIAFSTLDRHAESAEAFSRALQTREDDPNALFRIGDEYRVLGKPDTASVFFRKAFAGGKVNTTHSLRGIGLFLAGNQREAINELKLGFAEEDPKPLRTLQYLGLAYSNLHLYNEAIAAFREAIREDPDTAEEYNTYVNLGVQYYSLKQFQNAIEAFRESQRRNPRNTTAVQYIGYAFAELGDRASALRQYEVLKSREPAAAAQLLAYVTQKLPNTAPPR